MWNESLPVNTVNLVKKLLQFQRYKIFLRGYFFSGAPCNKLSTLHCGRQLRQVDLLLVCLLKGHRECVYSTCCVVNLCFTEARG